ncbi:cdc25c [Tritrichomonas foetus]|uniref:Cdc25c n=1 Tax=Tritrichomonas foetus TaxID=1144522 RepID=A0A1J4KXQ3_9EUKA|nr:cdc25c [Tritrichomonas foetus]|eukprot:OHT15664.1 cdc25c [Tritrichomonas foetus]
MNKILNKNCHHIKFFELIWIKPFKNTVYQMLSRTRSLCSPRKVQQYIESANSISNKKSNEPRRHSAIPKWLSNQLCRNRIKVSSMHPQQLASILTECDSCDYIVVIDSRFDYEFKSGHIVGALNVKTKGQLEKIYQRYTKLNASFIFYDDKSAHRSQMIISCIQRFASKYSTSEPQEFFVVQGGFQDFFKANPELCVGEYVSKNEAKFVNVGKLNRCNTLFRREFNQQIENIYPNQMLKESFEMEDILVIINNRLK